jgi:hypothetical protein
VLFDGPVNTDAERAALPEGMLKRLESLEGNVNIRIHPGKRQIKPKAGQKKNNKLL